MTFQSEWFGNETDSSGDVIFKVGEVERAMHFNEFADYHAVAQLLNEARRVGREEGVRDFAFAARTFARQEGIE